jgi:hypothetical protein
MLNNDVQYKSATQGTMIVVLQPAKSIFLPSWPNHFFAAAQKIALVSKVV